MGAGGLGTPVLHCFLPPYLHPSISVPLSVCFCLSVPSFVFCLSTSIACKIYVSLSVPSFCQLWARHVGTGKICNSLSVFLSPYLSANVFHLGFSISMSMQSLGCQTQLRGHYWQFRDWPSVKVRLIFLLSGRGARPVRCLSLDCPWSMWTLMCISKSCLTSDWLRK